MNREKLVSKTDPLFVKFVGCHQNRDLNRLFQQCKLHIFKSERYLLDMVHLVWAKPYKELGNRSIK